MLKINCDAGGKFCLRLHNGLQADDQVIFARDGFLVVDAAIDEARIRRILSAINKAFSGQFDTGAYPDSWLWQEGTSKENLPKQMVNAWKCSRVVAELILSETVARAACHLMGWEGTRLVH